MPRKISKPKSTSTNLSRSISSTANRRYIQPKTNNQKDYIRSIVENTISFCDGPSGSGKTHIAVGIGINHLLEGRYERLIITRPIVETGENLGALPGDANEKVQPYLIPIFDELKYFISYTELNSLLNQTDGGIDIVPLAFMRGRSFHKSFIIVDEAQNCTMQQLKMVLTRIGQGSKLIINGDLDQIDLPDSKRGALDICMKKLKNLQNVGIIKLEYCDIVRNDIIWSILECLNKEI